MQALRSGPEQGLEVTSSEYMRLDIPLDAPCYSGSLVHIPVRALHRNQQLPNWLVPQNEYINIHMSLQQSDMDAYFWARHVGFYMHTGFKSAGLILQYAYQNQHVLPRSIMHQQQTVSLRYA